MAIFTTTLKEGSTTVINPHQYRVVAGVIQISRDYGDTYYVLNQDSVQDSDGNTHILKVD